MNPKIVEELTFSVKVEDKPKLKQMQMDNLALALSLSKDRSQMDQLIQKGLGLKNNQSTETEQELYNQIYFRESTGAVPSIVMPAGRIQFQPWTTKVVEDEVAGRQIDSFSEILPRTSTYSAF
jgi:hypothetical protein